MASRVPFVGTIKGGKLHLDMRAEFDRYVAAAFKDGARVTVDVKRFAKKRTIKQNSYWWGVVITRLMLAINGNKGTKEERKRLHAGIMMKFFPMVEENGVTTYRSSTTLTTIECSDLKERVQAWAMEEYNCYIPDPNEENWTIGGGEE